MAKKINILVVEPGKAPRPARVDGTMETFQQIVGGPIEIWSYLPQRVLLICNSEARRMGLPPNRATPRAGGYIVGTFLLCSFWDDEFTSLSPAQQAEFQAQFAQPGEFMMLGADIICTSPGELKKAVTVLWESMKDGESLVMTRWGNGQKA